MRRPASEWLLVPVFLLPLLAAAALVWWARADYLARKRMYRANGARIVREWIEKRPDYAAELARRFTAAMPSPPAPEPPDPLGRRTILRQTDAPERWVPFRHPVASGFVLVRVARQLRTIDDPGPPWIVARDFPAGLTASAMASPSVRLAIETGAGPPRDDAVDPATAAFRDVITTKDRDRLRDAPLPASTKLWLAARIGLAADSTDVVALTALRDVAGVLDRGARFAPGVHDLPGRVRVLVPAGDAPWVVAADSGSLASRDGWEVGVVEAGYVRLHWIPLRRDPNTTPPGTSAWWLDRLDAPLAGNWALVAEHGDRWWTAPEFLETALPWAIGCLAFLFVPTALFISLRRRRKLDAARARFVTELAHDLRTPVASLRLHAEMLSEGRVAKADEPRYLAVLGRETARLSTLLAGLLDLSRLERGARDFEPQTIDVVGAVEDAVREFAQVHPNRAGDVTVDVPEPLAVSADATALARCLGNLLDNAGKFTDAGTPIRVSAARRGREVAILVADEGEGVPASERARVFELYERGAVAAKRAAPGTGIGLAVVRELMRGMGGSVTLLETQKGAAFELRLPEAKDG